MRAVFVFEEGLFYVLLLHCHQTLIEQKISYKYKKLPGILDFCHLRVLAKLFLQEVFQWC